MCLSPRLILVFLFFVMIRELSARNEKVFFFFSVCCCEVYGVLVFTLFVK